MPENGVEYLYNANSFAPFSAKIWPTYAFKLFLGADTVMYAPPTNMSDIPTEKVLILETGEVASNR